VVSRFDEYLVHQTEQTFARVASEHPEWQDRFYFNVHDREAVAGDEAAEHGSLSAYDRGRYVESLTASEIRTIFLSPGMARWADSDADALARADAAAFGFDQHCRFEMGETKGIGIVEYMVTGGHKRYGIPPVR
jgi:hypothetical protein